MYISWAAYYEGRTDAAYFNVLIPRFLESILQEEGVRPYDIGVVPSVEFGLASRSFEAAAREICDRRDEFHLLFVHADTGGRAQHNGIENRREALIERAHLECGFDRSVVAYISPRREVEAWAIADRDAVLAAFGLSRIPNDVLPRTPQAVERVEDPKAVLRAVGDLVNQRRRDSHGVLVRIAQEQNFTFLRCTPSFRLFERNLRNALHHIGCI